MPVRRFTAKNLALAALGLWLASLPFVAFRTYSGEHSVSGLQVLLTGWLGLLDLRFGWYANPFFLYAVFRLVSGASVPLAASVLAAVLALDTFRFDRIILNEGGTTAAVYGYGFGAITWLLAICALVAAAGLRLREDQSVDSHEPAGRVLAWLAAGSALMLIAISAGLGTYQRFAGNDTERARLSSIAFKRAAVCAAADPIPGRIVVDRRVLEVRKENAGTFPVNRPESILEWGIPIVRMNGWDYSLTDGGIAPVIVAQSASSESSLLLEVHEKRVADDVSFDGFVRLKLSAGSEVIFDQTWKREHRGIYCPDYRSFPSFDQNPRQVITAAMNIDRHAAGGTDARQRLQRAAKDLVKVQPIYDVPGRSNRTEFQNIGCAPDVGIRPDFLRSNPETVFLGRPLQVGSRFYFTTLRGDPRAICNGEIAYVLSSSRTDRGKLSLIAQKWNLTNAKLQWIVRILVEDDSKAMPAGRLSVWSVRENDGMLHLLLSSEKTARGLRVEVPLR